MKPIKMINLLLEYQYMKKGIDAAWNKCLKHQQWILGPEVAKLEYKISRYLGVDHCVGTASGTDALVIALRSLAITRFGQEDFSRNQEILTTPLTFTATGDAILRSGAKPVFVDINPDTFNIDPNKIRKYLQKKTKSVVGIVPVHLYGRPCAMDAIHKIAREFKLFVVEDVAQGFGGSWKGKKLGSLGDMSCFSFFPSKNMGGFGDGGMVATPDQKLAEIARILTKHGGQDKNNADVIGYNSRLDTLQAAVLLVKLKYLNDFNKKRTTIAKMYQTLLSDLQDITLPEIVAGHAFHQYTIRVPRPKREAIRRHLAANGIQTMVYYPTLLSQMRVFQIHGRQADALTAAEKVCPEILSLPIEPLLSKGEIKRVCLGIKAALEN